MVNYGNGKIYKIINENNEIIYIGSTAQKLCKRYSSHKLKSPNHKIILIENYSCNSKEELCMREQQIIEEHSNLLNQIRAYRTEEVKKQINRELCSKYYKNNIKEQKLQRKIYRENNKEEMNKKCKEWREKNQEHLKEYEEKRRNNPERIEYEKKRNEQSKQNKIICEFCNCEMSADSLKRHQKNNKICLAIQEQ